MFVAVIVGNVISALFAFCGLVLIGTYLCGERPQSAEAFVSQIALNASPLAIAAVIYLLVQIAIWLEKIYMQRSGQLPGSESSIRPMVPKRVASKSEQQAAPSDSGMFFRANAAPTHLDDEDDDDDVLTAPAVSKAQPAEESAPEADEKKTPEPPRSDLNFFRID